MIKAGEEEIKLSELNRLLVPRRSNLPQADALSGCTIDQSMIGVDSK